MGSPSVITFWTELGMPWTSRSWPMSNKECMMVAIMWQDNSGESNCINNETNDENMTCYTVTITP